jgi:replicative DNA helicase
MENNENKELFDLELEQSVIGGCIQNPSYAELLLIILKDEDFYYPEHQKIWNYLRKSYSINKGESEGTIGNFIRKVAGDGYLKTLMIKAVGVFAKECALEVKNLSEKRLIFKTAEKMMSDCLSGELTVEEIKEGAERDLGSIENQREGKTELASNAMTRVALSSTGAHDGTNSIIRTLTGLDGLDKMTGGFRPKELIILAARPAMGKSALAVNIAVNVAKQGKATLFFSFEMSNEEISIRILANEATVNSNKIKNGFASFKERELLQSRANEFKSLPLTIQDTAGVNINSLRGRIRKVAKKEEIGLVVIDYLQLIKGTRKNNRVEEVSEITRALKEMAMEFHIPILALSQLSRAVEQREDKRPQLSDLRESGSIEQDADIVLFVYREEYYLKNAKYSDLNKQLEHERKLAEFKGIAEINIAKQRAGDTGIFNLRFEPEFSRFINYF